MGSVDRNGVPHVAPLCHAFDGERRIAYVTTGGVTAANLRVRHRGVLECDDHSRIGTVSAAWWRAFGRRSVTRAELERAHRLLKRKFTQYRDTEIDSVIALHLEAVASWGL